MKPILASAASSAATDEQLVAAAREGNDEAVEALFRRYRERITAYACGIVADPGRAEDIVQETFMSALRSLRATDREITFKPWIYQIAKNACIDQLRRQGRTDEISIDSDDFKPQHEGRLSQAAPTTHKAVSQREDMHQLAQAFSGLPRSQHEILVLRELEGRSYEEIASRLHLSRSAVESMLFRARRGLRYEYDEITTGERCRRTHALIAAVSEGVGTARDRRAISRHARLCDGCRQEAVALGLGALVTRRRRGRVRSAIDKAAALMPFPLFRRRGHGAEASSPGFSARVQNAVSSFGSVASGGAEQAALLPKAVAAVAATVVIAGGGIVGHNSPGGSASRAVLGPAAGGALAPSGGVVSPGAPGQPPSGLSGLPTAGGTSGSPGLAGVLQGSQNASSGLSSPSLPSVFSPSLLPPAGGGSLSGQAGLIGGVPVPGGSSGSVLPTGSGLGLPGVGGIRLPGTKGGGGGSQTGSVLDQVPSGLGNTQLPKIDTSKVTDGTPVTTPSLPKTPKVPKVPTTTTPSLPSTGTTLPALPSAPATPSVPDPTATTQSTLNTINGAVNGVTGATGPALPHLGL